MEVLPYMSEDDKKCVYNIHALQGRLCHIDLVAVKPDVWGESRL